jgi:hypothetical protein
LSLAWMRESGHIAENHQHSSTFGIKLNSLDHPGKAGWILPFNLGQNALTTLQKNIKEKDGLIKINKNNHA